MPPAPKAKWTTKNNEITAVSATDGSFIARVPLYDAGVRQGWFNLRIDADRKMALTWEEVTGAVGLSDFQAWWREAQ